MKKYNLRRIVLFCGVVAVALGAALVPSTVSQGQDAKPAAATNTSGTNVVSTNAVSHTLAAKDPVAAWLELEEASKPPTPPMAWQLKEPTPDEQIHFLMPYVMVIADKARDFSTRFPNDTNALAARQREFGILSWVADNGNTNAMARLDAVEKMILTDTNLAEDDRLSIRQHDVERAIQAKESEGESAMLVEVEKGARALLKEFPKRPELMSMLMEVAENSDAEKASGLVKEIMASEASAELKEGAADLKKTLDRVGKPLDLKFTAVDGREVELAKMQGKVVLVDFWATWCEPCVAELPHVKEAYDKLHGKGFEIVGISLDQEKENLTNFTAAQKMEWPQYFDGLYWQTKFAVEYGVHSVPAMWLVDKKGVLRHINAGFDLNKKVEGLLAE